MNILIVAATENEISQIDFSGLQNSIPHELEILITGVGSIEATYSLLKKISETKFDLAMNVGVAGSFNDKIPIGEVVNVVSDCFADLGVEDDEKFLNVYELGLADENEFPFLKGKLIPGTSIESTVLEGLKKVNAITVNKVHGNEKSIKQAKNIFNPDIESMEGAAFFYVCMKEKIPCLQLRAISNKVEKRNRDAWNIPLAIKNLNDTIGELIESIK